MSGYKRVNFYELCRLCASNHQKEKTHIFQEEGRKIQLQNKIQSCLSLTVCENDFLPKVVCSQCLRSLEECYVFRKECVTSETMLSSYFKNFRYTEDFKKSGKVYIKDTSSKASVSASTEPVTSTTSNNVAATETIKTTQSDQIPLYTVQFPSLMPSQQNTTTKQTKVDVNKPQNVQLSYNPNTLQLKSNQKMNVNDALNNIAVNSNGEIINIAQLVDIDSIINQASVQKFKKQPARNKANDINKQDESNVIKIDLTQPDMNSTQFDPLKYEKLPHIKSTQPNKFTYTIKLDETKANQAVILNQLSDLNANLNNNQNLTNFNIGNFNSLNNNYNTTANVVNQNATLNYAPNNILQGDMNVSYNNAVVSNKQVNYSCRTNSLPLTTSAPSVSQSLMTCAANVVMTTSNNYIANKTFTSNSTFANQQPTAASTEPTKVHVCDVCKKTFKRREHLFQHVKLHTGFRPFTCENCNKSFMRKEHLLRHMTSHSGQKNFTCNICEKSFSRNDNLLKHKKTHEKQSSFTCEICQKQFVMKHYYLAHKMTHENDKCNVNQVWGLLKA